MAFINAGRHLSTAGLTAAVLMDLQIMTQGNIVDLNATPPVYQFPWRGQPGTPLESERTLQSLPDFIIGETVTGSTNSYTSVYEGVSLMGTSELASSVGGGYGGPGEICGYGGGSGGGGASNNWGRTLGGISVLGQGFDGGSGGDRQGSGGGGSGGGGGASAAGGAGQTGGSGSGPGGNGANNAFRTGTNIVYAGGGGGAGGGVAPTSAAGGTGGGGTGASGAANLGGGGGTGVSASNGGSGIVVVRYDTSQSGFSLTGGTTNTYTTGAVNYQSHTFLTSGAIVVTGTGNIDSMIISGGGGAGGHGSAPEGGFFRGGGGAGGMHVTTNTQMVPGTYAVEIGAGGAGSSNQDTEGAGTGNLSWITPRRTISLSNPTGAYVTGETLTGGTSGATGDVIIYYP
jgi:hypothetical protein